MTAYDAIVIGTGQAGPYVRRLKGYRRIFSRLEKLDAMFLGFLALEQRRPRSWRVVFESCSTMRTLDVLNAVYGNAMPLTKATELPRLVLKLSSPGK